MSGNINFIANTKDFKSVKKMRVLPEVKDIDLLEFLVSVEVTTNIQINRLLEKIFNLTVINQEVSKLFSKDASSFLKEINSNSFLKVIESNVYSEYKGDLKEIVPIIKSYVFNRYLIENNLIEENAVGYYRILFPTRKRQLKKAILK